MSYWPRSCEGHLVPLKHACTINPDVLGERTAPDFEFDYVDIGNVTLQAGVADVERMTFEISPSRARKPVKQHDAVISTVRTYLRAVAQIDQKPDVPLVVSTGFAVLRSDKHHPRYLFRAIQSSPFIEEVVARSTGVSYPAINPSTLGAIPIPLPPPETQRAIADFLDRETARIDQLIQKKQRLVELLEDRETAIVAKYLANGLDNQTSTKPSGHDWLQHIPSHWSIQKLAWHFRAEKGKNAQTYTKEYCAENPGEYPVYSGQTENEGVMGKIASYDYDFSRSGVLFSTTVGAKAMEMMFLKGKLSLSQNCMLIIPLSEKMPIRYFYHQLRMLFRRERQLIPAHMQPSFRVDDLHKYWIAFPPFEEAHAIGKHIDQLIGKTRRLVTPITNSIDCLREFRSALITAAVTGQIDVNEWSRRGRTDAKLDAIAGEMEAGA